MDKFTSVAILGTISKKIGYRFFLKRGWVHRFTPFHNLILTVRSNSIGEGGGETVKSVKIDDERMSTLHQNLGGIGKSIPSALEISLDPRDFPRASPSGNLLGLGKSWASGMDFPIPPSFWWIQYTILAFVLFSGEWCLVT